MHSETWISYHFHVIKYPSFVCFSKHLKWKLILNPRAVQNQALAQTWEQAGPKRSFASCTLLPKNSKSGNDDGTSGKKKKNQCLKDDSDQILLSWAPGECTQSLPAAGIFPQHSAQWASNNPTPVTGSVNPPARSYKGRRSPQRGCLFRKGAHPAVRRDDVSRSGGQRQGRVVGTGRSHPPGE